MQPTIGRINWGSVGSSPSAPPSSGEGFSGARIDWGSIYNNDLQQKQKQQQAFLQERSLLQQQQRAKGLNNPSSLLDLQAKARIGQVSKDQFIQALPGAAQGAKGAAQPTLNNFKATPLNFIKALGPNTVNTVKGIAQGTARTIPEVGASAKQLITGKPTTLQPNKIDKILFGNAPIQSIQEEAKGAQATHPGGFHIPGTPITLSPKATGLAEGALHVAQDAPIVGGLAKGIVKGGEAAIGKGVAAAGKDVAVGDLIKNTKVSTLNNVDKPLPSPAEATPKINPASVTSAAGKASYKAPPELQSLAAKVHNTPFETLTPTPVESKALKTNNTNLKDFYSNVKGSTTPLNEAGGIPLGNVQDYIDKHQQSVKFSGDIQRFAHSSEGAKGNLLNDAAKVIKNRTQLAPEEKTQLQALRDARATNQALPQVSDKVVQANKEATAFAKATIKNDVERAKLEGNLQKAEKLKERNPETYTHRVAQGKGSAFDYVLQNDRKSPLSVNFGKTTPADKTRVYHALTDEQGNRQVVAIKNRVFKNEAGQKVSQGKLVTSIGKDGELKDMGLLNKPPIKKVDEFYDKNVREALNKTAQNLGIKVEKTTSRRGAYAGKSLNGRSTIVLKAGAPSRTMLHEIGHQLDEKYGLQKMFVNNKNFKQELRNLTDLRHEGQTTTNSFKQYVRKGEEKIASMFEAYLHTPDRFKETAPKSFAAFEKFLKSHPETKPIANYKPSMVLGKETVASGPEQLPGEFIDKNGKTYKIGDATTAEIEKVGNTHYYKDPALTNHAAYLDSRVALENARMFDAIKKSPEAKTFMVEPGETAPKGWKPAPGVAQFQGYKFEPRAAQAITDMFGAREPAALSKASKLLRQTIVYFPIKHDFNMAAAYAMDRGASSLANPMAYGRMFKSWAQAAKDIHTKSDFYQAVAKKGFGLTTNDKKAFEDTFKKELQKLQPGAINQVAKLANLNPAKLYTAVQRLSVWDVQDFLNLARIHERMSPTLLQRVTGKKTSLEDAVKQTEKYSFQYKVPSRVMGSRTASKTLRSPVIFFGAYKYDQYKMVANALKGMVNISKPGEALKNADKVAALAVGALLLWPKVNKEIQNLTGDPNAHMTAPGPLDILESINKIRTKQQTAGQAAGNQVSIGPLQQILNIKNNTDSFTGKKIADPNTTEGQQMAQRGKYLFNQLAPVQKAAGTKNVGAGKQVIGTILSLAGASLPKNSPQATKLNSLKYDTQPNAYADFKQKVQAGDIGGAKQIANNYNKEVLNAAKDAIKASGKPVPSDSQLYNDLRKGQYLLSTSNKTISNAQKKSQNTIDKLLQTK